jgi:hypothetical protein
MQQRCQHEAKLVCAMADMLIKPSQSCLLNAREIVLNAVSCRENKNCSCDKQLIDGVFNLFTALNDHQQ